MTEHEKTIQAVRDFNRFYTVNMGFLSSEYLGSEFSVAETRVLYEIMQNEGGICTQSDIVRLLGIDKSYLSRIISRLCAKGLVKKMKSKTDGRSVEISLTERGISQTNKLVEMTNLEIGKNIFRLGKSECESLCKAFETITGILGKGEQKMRVVQFEEKYRKDFINFNTDWIVSNFGFLEQHDLETFDRIDEEIAAGAMIFFAVEGDTVLAACMATPMSIPNEEGTWEICKLCSNKNVPHKGAGSAVFGAAMDWAVSHGAKRLFILSNSKLKPALHIYEKFGFKEIKLADYEYERGDIAFEYICGGNSDDSNRNKH